MVVISTIFRHYHMPFYCDDLTLLLRVLEGLKMFLQISSLFLTEITRDENYRYILKKQGPY